MASSRDEGAGERELLRSRGVGDEASSSDATGDAAAAAPPPPRLSEGGGSSSVLPSAGLRWRCVATSLRSRCSSAAFAWPCSMASCTQDRSRFSYRTCTAASLGIVIRHSERRTRTHPHAEDRGHVGACGQASPVGCAFAIGQELELVQLLANLCAPCGAVRRAWARAWPGGACALASWVLSDLGEQWPPW